MKKNYSIMTVMALLTLGAIFWSFKTKDVPVEFTSFTVVESIVPNGAGRSRIISVNDKKDYKEYTKTKTAEDKGRNKSKRGDIRSYNYDETKLLNFYNIGGIRFQNIAANDAVINSKVEAMLAAGWELVNISAGVESNSGKDDGAGIYITRFYFKK